MRTFTTLIVAFVLAAQPVSSATLRGHIDDAQIMTVRDVQQLFPELQTDQLPAEAQESLSAIGVIWDRNRGNTVVYIDPASEFQGRIGDRIVCIDKQSPQSKANFGLEDTLVEVIIWRQGVFYTQRLHRKSIEVFQPVMQQALINRLSN